MTRPIPPRPSDPALSFLMDSVLRLEEGLENTRRDMNAGFGATRAEMKEAVGALRTDVKEDLANLLVITAAQTVKQDKADADRWQIALDLASHRSTTATAMRALAFAVTVVGVLAGVASSGVALIKLAH